MVLSVSVCSSSWTRLRLLALVEPFGQQRFRLALAALVLRATVAGTGTAAGTGSAVAGTVVGTVVGLSLSLVLSLALLLA